MSLSWDFEVIARNLDRLPRDCKAYVLLSTGALNPVHIGHVEMMERAAQSLQKTAGLLIVGGFLSPSHELYVAPKSRALGTIYFPTRARVRFCVAALTGHPLLKCGLWESDPSHNHWPDFPEVCAALLEALRQTFPDRPGLEVVYVCGLDHSTKCGLHRGMRMDAINVAIVPREGAAPSSSTTPTVYSVLETNLGVEDISSTAIRKALKEKTSLDGLVHAAVVPLLYEEYAKIR